MEFDFPPAEALAVTEEPVVRYRLKRIAQAEGPAEDAPEISSGDPKIIRFPRTFAAAASSPYLEEERTSSGPEGGSEAGLSQQPQQSGGPAMFETAEEIGQTVAGVPQQPIRAEQLDLLPNFEDIRLESAHVSPARSEEVIPNPAPLQQRCLAALVDFSTVATAAVLFDVTFVRLAEDDPRSRMALLCGVGVTAILWFFFQYLFMVHGHGTPGMRLAELELATLDGKPVPLNARRCRALASALSAFSLGLGYAWAFIDEDQLGWHDRMTGTVVRAIGHQSTDEIDIWG
jgi:uncharacterized RDD family membrane protein YckC